MARKITYKFKIITKDRQVNEGEFKSTCKRKNKLKEELLKAMKLTVSDLLELQINRVWR